MKHTICSGCDYNFNGITAFEKHRIGDYGDAIYQARATGTTQKVVGYTPITRRCMTDDEMEAAGLAWSLEQITCAVEGQSTKRELITWSLPLSEKGREQLATLHHTPAKRA